MTPHIDDNSVYVDGIIHSEIKNQSKDLPKIKLIEKRFKNMLAMKGVKLIYKRDMFWRTWRVVSFSDNSKRALYYKCTHIINSNCSDCFGGGFWIIEEDQIKCPYEIYSMVNKNQICVANYSQMEKIHEKCPSVASLTDLVISCGNPIKTMYRVTKTLSHFISERNQTDICGGREYCGISTFYRINEDYITFRILDSSNDIIFSKIMKPDMKNFACVTNCGLSAINIP
ncbi:hypothetical protein ABMA27_012347 [Loxostege sticticalis]|uniref:Uncharacterized protein n=1 Tax=Loxostege sticticalis TaxID=481309 RepID=A0ABR3H119_LOXSC